MYGGEISAEICGALRVRSRPDPSRFKDLPEFRALGTIEALSSAVIDPPVTPEERVADAMSAFGLLCDRAIEYLDLLGWEDTLNVDSPGGGSG